MSNFPERRFRIPHLLDLGRHAEAEQLATSLLAEDPSDPDLLGYLAQARLGLDDHRGALDAANRLVAADPDEEWGHRIAAIALGGVGRHEEAVLAASRSVTLAPHDWHTHHVLALVATEARGQLRLARRAAEEAVRLAPNEASPHFGLGVVADSQHHWDVAKRAYERALAIDPEHAGALHNLTMLNGGARLSRTAHGLGAALRLAPESETMRENVDVLAARFVRRLYYASLIALVVGLVAAVAAGDIEDGGRITPLTLGIGSVLAIGCVTYTVLLARAVPVGIRRYVTPRLVRDRFLLANVVLTAAMFLTALAVCFVPGGAWVGLVALRPLGFANVAIFVWAMVRRTG